MTDSKSDQESRKVNDKHTWSIETNTECRIQCPATDVQLTPSLVRQNDTTRAEHVCLRMHFPPRAIELPNETQVEFVAPGRVGKA